jgi:hypothetical protein
VISDNLRATILDIIIFAALHAKVLIARELVRYERMSTGSGKFTIRNLNR